MSLSHETIKELKQARHVYYPSEFYLLFLVKWIAFNRAYNELFPVVDSDKAKVIKFGELMRDRWEVFRPLAYKLVSLECVGGKRVSGSRFLKPISDVKWTTLWLREQLALDAPDENKYHFCSCRPDKRRLCDAATYSHTNAELWQSQGELAALLRLVYQVRCNVFHGEKSLVFNTQTDRDKELISIAEQVVDYCLDLLLEQYNVGTKDKRR